MTYNNSNYIIVEAHDWTADADKAVAAVESLIDQLRLDAFADLLRECISDDGDRPMTDLLTKQATDSIMETWQSRPRAGHSLSVRLADPNPALYSRLRSEKTDHGTSHFEYTGLTKAEAESVANTVGGFDPNFHWQHGFSSLHREYEINALLAAASDRLTPQSRVILSDAGLFDAGWSFPK